MKEVKEARKQQEKLLERIEAQIAYYDDILRFETGGGCSPLPIHRKRRIPFW